MHILDVLYSLDSRLSALNLDYETDPLGSFTIGLYWTIYCIDCFTISRIAIGATLFWSPSGYIHSYSYCYSNSRIDFGFGRPLFSSRFLPYIMLSWQLLIDDGRSVGEFAKEKCAVTIMIMKVRMVMMLCVRW